MLSFSKYELDLKNYNWAFPYFIDVEELHSILKSVSDEKEFDVIINNKCTNKILYFILEQIQEIIPDRHKILIRQIKKNISLKNYIIINNALLSIIDNCLSFYLEDKGCVSRKEFFKPIIEIYDGLEVNSNTFFVFELVMLSNNIDFIFDSIDFNNVIIDSHKEIRRHTSIHGFKYSNKRIDSIMLINTLMSLLNISKFISPFEKSLVYDRKNKKFKLNDKPNEFIDELKKYMINR